LGRHAGEALQLLDEPEPQPFEEGGLVVVHAAGELLPRPASCLIGVRLDRHAEPAARGPHPPCAARASSTSRPSLRIRTSMYSSARTAAITGMEIAEPTSWPMEEMTIGTRTLPSPTNKEPTMVHGTDRMLVRAPTRMTVSSVSPKSRQNWPLVSRHERLSEANTPVRSSTIAQVANSSRIQKKAMIP